MRKKTAYECLLAAAICLASTGAHAQEDNAGDVAAARALGVEGVRLADAGECNEAIDKLQRAEKLHHAVSTLARLGECQVAVGKLVEGTENLQRAIREALPPNAPAPFVAAQERARKVLSEARPRIARLKIAIAAPPDAQLAIKVDGESMPAANLNTNRLVDPGEHTVEASAPGYLRASAKVKLAEGGADSVALTLEPDPNAPKPEPVAKPGGATSRSGSGAVVGTPAPADGRDRTAAIVVGGVGLLGVALGAGFGFAAMGAKSDLDKACVAKSCPSDQQSKLDSAKTLGTASTIGFVVGGVGLAAAAVLFFVDFRASAQATATREPARLRAYVGPTSAGVIGAF